MHKGQTKYIYSSPVAHQIELFLKEKHAVGYKFVTESILLRAFDRYLISQNHTTCDLPRYIVEPWIAKRAHESAKTHYLRARVVAGFTKFLAESGINVYIPDTRLMKLPEKQYVPKIFTHAEIKQLLKASTELPFDTRSTKRHKIMPEIFHFLYCCGMRCSEVLNLRVSDLDLKSGIIKIWQGKNRKDRFIPISKSLSIRMKRYMVYMGNRSPEEVLFPSPTAGFYGLAAVYHTFRHLLRVIGISHGGRGIGPRVHDLRHTFAVHRLEAWYRKGEDLGAKLPLLATYMGHKNIYGTLYYLRLTAEIFPDIVEQFQNSVWSRVSMEEEQ